MQDWIKMRTDIYRDPKVCLMADHLMDPKGDLARYVNQNVQCNMSVTRNVIRCATVGATLAVWGVMRHRGKRNGDDLVCNGVTLAVLDDIADLPGFGDAMEACGWAVQTDEGICFPRFFSEYNVEIDTKGKSSAAERQARYRQNKKAKSDGGSDVTRDVTRDGREEKRREEKSRVVEQQAQEHAAKPVRSVFRKPSVQDVAEYVTSVCADIDPQTFIDHYEANGWKIGGKAPMKDWKAAVRTWHKRREEQRDNEQQNNAVKAGWTAQARQDAQWAVFAEFDAAARRDNERRAASSGGGGSAGHLTGNHASLFGEKSGADD